MVDVLAFDAHVAVEAPKPVVKDVLTFDGHNDLSSLVTTLGTLVVFDQARASLAVTAPLSVKDIIVVSKPLELLTSDGTKTTDFLVITGSGPAGPPGPVGPADATFSIDAHINAPLPHPVYDDITSLTLMFENRLV